MLWEFKRLEDCFECAKKQEECRMGVWFFVSFFSIFFSIFSFFSKFLTSFLVLNRLKYCLFFEGAAKT